MITLNTNKLDQKSLDKIVSDFQAFFRTEIAENHINNTKKLINIEEFNLNPFLDIYKAQFLTGKKDALSIAKALVYPRVLGTSINTSFGQQFQRYCSQLLEGFSSTTSGIDIEFIDKLDGRRKYCQIKAGPNTINADDVITIQNHYTNIKNLARTNHLNIGIHDLVVGILYGEKDEINTHYKRLDQDYPVFVGQDFWYRLTGHENFYQILTNAVGEVAQEFDSSKLVDEVITEVANKIEKHYLT
ncbi:MAG TPA: PmeII family type II restriction endonuclease [Alloiococcus sp.]|nr:PmeII family type II restriction endonuclease [Alloiococcus sp.]